MKFTLSSLLLLASTWVAEAKWEVVRECCLPHETFPDCGRRRMMPGDDGDDLGDQGDYEFDPDEYEANLNRTIKFEHPFGDTTSKTSGLHHDDDEGTTGDDALGSISLPSRGLRRKLETKGPYQIKMYWEKDFCWQAEKRERRWCMECVGGECHRGDNFWTMRCDKNDHKQKIEYVVVSHDLGQLRVHNTNLCLQKFDNFFKLQDCNENNRNQLFEGFKDNGDPFRLRPLTDNSKCVTNYWHHPKNEELLWAQKCSHPGKHNTDRWQALTGGVDPVGSSSSSSSSSSNQESQNRVASTGRLDMLGRDFCTPRKKCKVCQGDCDGDNACEGDLKCWTHEKVNGKVPGCSGSDFSGDDFCYDPKANEESSKNGSGTTTGTSSGSTGSSGGRPPIKPMGSNYCTEKRKCGLCEGDCDNSDQCQDGLKCPDRGSNEALSACSGGESDSSRNDYCIPE